MPPLTNTRDAFASSAAADQVEKCIAALERDWTLDRVRPLHEYLPEGDDAFRRQALVELVKVELELQWRANRRPAVADYCRCYPELGTLSTAPTDLVYEAYRLLRQHADSAAAAEFWQHFPGQRSAALKRERLSRLPSFPLGIDDALPMQFEPGRVAGDFEIVELIGLGSLSHVFLARQISLDRLVALKATSACTHEAVMLARLEHDHIVRVFSEAIDGVTGMHLLCMQYVPGATLGAVIDFWNSRPQRQWSGRLLLESVGGKLAPPNDVEHNRNSGDKVDQLCHADLSETVCLLGRQLASALGFAHAQGVLHRDVKPANILLDRTGRAFLTDFNLSLDARRDDCLFGGSCAYMAPEHLDAFALPDQDRQDRVDARSDVYSLGVVLYELATGRRPFLDAHEAASREEAASVMIAARRQAPRLPHLQNPCIAPPLSRVIQRALHPEPDRRFQSADALAAALDGARDLHRMAQRMPPPGLLTRAAKRRPVAVTAALALAPNALGVAIVLIYFALTLYGEFNEPQRQRFTAVAWGYTLVVFTLALLLTWAITSPKRRVWSALRRGQSIDAQHADIARRRTVEMPLWGAGLALGGWLPGAIVFPVLMTPAFDGHIPGSLIQLGALFALCGCIGATYSYFASEFVDMRIGYLPMLREDDRPLVQARRDLAPVAPRIRRFQLFAGAMPLAAAACLLLMGPQESDPAASVFRALIGIAMALTASGFVLATRAANVLFASLAALTDSRTPPP
jgi:serine/threonine protein kinase